MIDIWDIDLRHVQLWASDGSGGGSARTHLTSYFFFFETQEPHRCIMRPSTTTLYASRLCSFAGRRATWAMLLAGAR